MNRRERFQHIQTYGLYYGGDHVHQLSRFDCAIVEPSVVTRDQLHRLQRSDTLVLAYVSVMEALPSYSCWPLLQDDDFLTQDGHRMEQSHYGSFLMDLQSRRWQGILVRSIGQLLVQDGYDGVFLDTIGDVERPDIPGQSHQIVAAVNLVRSFRNLFPQHILVQNNGLEMLCLKTGPYLDGLMWENPPVGHAENADWLEAMCARLHDIEDRLGVKALVLFDQHDGERALWALRRRFADTQGFTTYFAEHGYVSGVRTEFL